MIKKFRLRGKLGARKLKASFEIPFLHLIPYVSHKFWGLVSWTVSSILLFFTARRWLFTVLALFQAHPAAARQLVPESPLPLLLLLVPVRNEREALPGLLSALDRLDYPVPRLTLVFIDDGSTDGSAGLIRRWAAGRQNWHLLRLEQNVGKAKALNFGLANFSQADLVVIYDADERPRPDSLAYLVASFSDGAVGAVSGRRTVANGVATPAAGYVAFESLVHQLVTMQAKDKLNLAPAILGSNCAYRRIALEQVGFFRPGVLLEDTDLTLKLVRAGWQTRFEPRAVSYHAAPETAAGYWRQHTRWARGFNEVAKAQAGSVMLDQQLSPLLRLELLAFSVGYLDRLALLAGGGLLVLGRAGRLLPWSLGLSLLTPLLQIVAALRIGREPPAMWGRIIWVPLFFSLDVAMAAAGLWRTLKQSPKIWEERRSRR